MDGRLDSPLCERYGGPGLESPLSRPGAKGLQRTVGREGERERERWVRYLILWTCECVWFCVLW